MSAPGRGASNRLSARLQQVWWRSRPTLLARLLQPLAVLYGLLAGLDRWLWQSGWRRAVSLPVPVLVVGNLIVGGAGKTPVTIALTQCLQRHGWRPGVVSRGYGRSSQGLRELGPDASAAECGDEPLLIRRRTGVPVVVAKDRAAAAQALLAAHPGVNLIIADDGLQHWRLRRDLQVVVFDARGVGNGLLLPAGPLRQPLPAALPPLTWPIYNADRPSTALPGPCAARRLAGAVALDGWWQGQPASESDFETLCQRSIDQPILAAAGLADPERFFGMLEARGLRIRRLPLADHAALDALPWPADTPELLLTEKDAVKLRPSQVGATRVWVVALDFELPAAFEQAIVAALSDLAPPSP